MQLNLEPGEIYYEWVDVLEAIEASHQKFIMIEVGAGRAARGKLVIQALKGRSLTPYFVFVEGEPYRAHKEINEVMQKEGIPPTSYQIFPYCVGKKELETLFYFTSERQNLSLDNWLGQSKILADDTVETWTDRTYMGKNVGITRMGYEVIRIQQKKFSELLNEVEHPLIDLCDFDIQGSEFEVIAESIQHLNERVKRLHIGTHSIGVEYSLIKLLKKHRWKLLRYYPCHSNVETDFGKAHFIDGVQTWINPKIVNS